MRIEWEKPRHAIRGSGVYAAFYEALKKHRMKWAIFKRRFKSATSTYEKQNPGFEFVVRSEKDGSRTCYARYVGGTRGKRGKKAKK